MAGASMNDIKSRMKSVTGTMQITKAMELVATSKLRKAKERAEGSRLYAAVSAEAIGELLAIEGIDSTPYFHAAEGGKALYVVIAGDRGLAGGYNNNIFRLYKEISRDTDAVVLPFGKKALEHFRHAGVPVYSDAFEIVGAVSVGPCFHLSREIVSAFLAGEYTRVELVYTRFVSMLTQLPTHRVLLPLEKKENVETSTPFVEGDDLSETLFHAISDYVGGQIYAAISESLASESGARRTAMNAASKNATEMMDDLTLRYNRARQAVITQEITEIVSGAEAL